MKLNPKILVCMVLAGTLLFSCTGTLVPIKQIPDGLIAHYPFSENANDHSGNNIHGIVYNAVLTTDRSGNENSAYEFNGDSAYIELTEDSLLHFGSNDYSISLWIQLANLDIKAQGIISGYNAAGNQREFKLGVNLREDQNYFKIYNDGIADGGDLVWFDKTLDWQHVSVTKDSSALKLYVNGSLVEQVPVTATMKTTGTRILIGAIDFSNTSPDELFKGKIDDIYIHNRALEGWEIDDLFEMN